MTNYSFIFFLSNSFSFPSCFDVVCLFTLYFTNAYQIAIDVEMSVRKAAKIYGVLMQTLRDR